MSEQLDRVTDEETNVAIERGPNEPLMPFPTSYILTKEQEDELIDHAINRKTTLETELGRDDGLSTILDEYPDYNDTYEAQDRLTRSFMGKRRVYDLMYRTKVGWRARILGGIFIESNLTLPITRRITRQMTARANNYFFSTEPWFAAYPVSDSDTDKTDDAEKFTTIKMQDARLKADMEACNERAFTIGEGIMKVTHVEDDRIYKTFAEVLIDENGADILAQDGDYITQKDLWVPSSFEKIEMTGEVIASKDFVLKRDNQTPQPANMLWEEKLITRRKVIYSGPKADIVHYRDFLCPLAAPSIQDADCIIHLYDMPVMDLADAWRKKQVIEGADASQEATAAAIDLIRSMSGETSEPKSAKNSRRAELNDSSDLTSQAADGEPVSEIAEFYMHYDANGDGIMEDVILILDVKNRTPIFYDYVQNYTEDGLRPFVIHRINPVEGRWYGEGAMEMFESSQDIIDKSVNRWNFSQMGSGRVDFWNPEATMEGQNKPNLELNTGITYTLRNGRTAEDALQSVALHDVKFDEVQGIMELFTQYTMNESGVQNVNDGNVAGSDSTKLATGIRNIEKSGQEMFSVYLSHLEPCITETLRKMVAVMNGNLDPNDVVNYLEKESKEFIQIAASDIRDFEIDVRILLSRYKAEQALESNARASELVKDYYAQPYLVQVQIQKLYVNMLKEMQIADAETIIMPVQVLELPTQGGTQNVSGASAPDRLPPAQNNL